ncbi:MAG: LysR family transcriptional regulator [Synergistaceae bacterium]|nr:LysR family transcriptional regulator [Synergistaceae bacterium]
MDFRELTYFVCIAKHQNMTRAAEELHVSQPSLSQVISSLEKDTGLKLFDRIERKYKPTFAGERYLSYARQILETKANLDSELDDIIKREVGVLNIGLPNVRCTFMLPKTLPEFNAKYPNVKVNIFEGTSAVIDKRLMNGDIDLAFYSKPHELNANLEYETLAAEELLICTCKNKFSAQNKRLDLHAIKNERLILLSPEQRTGQISRYYLQINNISLENSITINNMPAVISLTEQGWGVSFIFESHLRWHSLNGQRPDLDTFSFGQPESPMVMSDFVAAYRKNYYMPKYARDFIEAARELYA